MAKEDKIQELQQDLDEARKELETLQYETKYNKSALLTVQNLANGISEKVGMLENMLGEMGMGLGLLIGTLIKKGVISKEDTVMQTQEGEKK